MNQRISTGRGGVTGYVIAIICAIAFLVAGLSGCGAKNTEPYHDGPRSGVVNRDAADLITMPDGFSNVATKCDHGNRIYIAFKGDANRAAIAVVPADPTCKK